jgi:hypothetical protein
MANIILYTDFTGKINLPNTLPGKSEGDALASFITDNEATYLTEALVLPQPQHRVYGLIYGKVQTLPISMAALIIGRDSVIQCRSYQ